MRYSLSLFKLWNFKKNTTFEKTLPNESSSNLTIYFQKQTHTNSLIGIMQSILKL